MKKKRSDNTRRRKRDTMAIITSQPHHLKAAEFEKRKLCATPTPTPTPTPYPASSFCLRSIFAQVSRNVAVRLKTSFSGFESGSTQK